MHHAPGENGRGKPVGSLTDCRFLGRYRVNQATTFFEILKTRIQKKAF